MIVLTHHDQWCLFEGSGPQVPPDASTSKTGTIFQYMATKMTLHITARFTLPEFTTSEFQDSNWSGADPQPALYCTLSQSRDVSAAMTVCTGRGPGFRLHWNEKSQLTLILHIHNKEEGASGLLEKSTGASKMPSAKGLELGVPDLKWFPSFPGFMVWVNDSQHPNCTHCSSPSVKQSSQGGSEYTDPQATPYPFTGQLATMASLGSMIHRAKQDRHTERYFLWMFPVLFFKMTWGVIQSQWKDSHRLEGDLDEAHVTLSGDV